MTAATLSPPRPQQRTLAGLPLLLPNRRDPRLQIALVVMTLQVLGQTVLKFKVSVAQILVTLLACAIVEIFLTARSSHVLAWPASALLTGNGVALLLRTSGTRHGDWWSLNGIEWFLLAGVGGLLSKHFYRPDGRHVFNPANLGLVVVLAVIGSPRVYPQYLWWGPFAAPSVIAALAVIIAGGLFVLRRLGLVPALSAFLGLFAVGIGVLAASGTCMVAVWRTGPVCGSSYFLNIAFSPEVLVFAGYMLTDPKTVPATARGRTIFGAGTACLALILVSTQGTEYGIKLAILASLALACAVVPVLTSLLPSASPQHRSRLVDAAVLLALAGIVGTGLSTIAHDPALLNLERGIRPVGSPGQ